MGQCPNKFDRLIEQSYGNSMNPEGHVTHEILCEIGKTIEEGLLSIKKSIDDVETQLKQINLK